MRTRFAFAGDADISVWVHEYRRNIFHDEDSVLRWPEDAPEYCQHRLLPRKLAYARLCHRRHSCRTDLTILAATG